MGEPTRGRVIIESVKPDVDGGRFPIKRVVGEKVRVEADVIADGHDVLSCVLLYRKEGARQWNQAPMTYVVNDRWQGEFVVTELGRYNYTLRAWVDRFRSWQRDLRKRVDAGQDVSVELQIGADLVQEAGDRASRGDKERLVSAVGLLSGKGSPTSKVDLALDDDLARLVGRYPDVRSATTYHRELAVVVDRERARFSAWYEMFPRSCSPEADRHGTFEDCAKRLAYVGAMGFDVLYLPPIHPIGSTHRKGKNNSPVSGPHDPGSPWAIGSKEGGHKAVHRELGTLEDFRRLVDKAREHSMEIALDLAFQCSADHPYVKEHPEWLRWRPDGTVQYAENPPKKYEDIYPIDFDTEHWQELWEELKSIVLFWIDQGVRIFRVDNPHTKPFAFWEWLIDSVKREHPDVLFLAEAFTRPKIMYRLAKLGFAQSYTYFAWRNTRWELTQYFTELAKSDVREYLRPSLWPNTPDILTEYLQSGGRPAFMARLVLAATLGASYGIYGPAFELCESRAREPGGEEYLDSEKFEIKHWDLDRPNSLKDFIARVNRIRRENPALHSDESLSFHRVDNEQLLCYSKRTEDSENIIIVVVNLDPNHTHSGWIEFDPRTLQLDPQKPYQAHDLLTDARYLWHGTRNYVEVDPHVAPAHIFRVRRRVRTEEDFDYYT